MIEMILLLAANFVGTLLMELSLSYWVAFEVIVLLLLLGLTAYILMLRYEDHPLTWNMLTAYFSISIANLTFLFFAAGQYLVYIALMVMNLIGMAYAVFAIRDSAFPIGAPAPAIRSPASKPFKSSADNNVHTQVVEIPQESQQSPRVIPYTDHPHSERFQEEADRSASIDTYSEFRGFKDLEPTDSDLETYDAKNPVIEPDPLYNSPYSNIENGQVESVAQPKLIVKLPKRPARKVARKAKPAKRAKAKKAVKAVKKASVKPKTAKTAKTTLKTIKVIGSAKKAKKSQGKAKRKSAVTTKETTTKVITITKSVKAPKKQAKPAKRSKGQPTQIRVIRRPAKVVKVKKTAKTKVNRAPQAASITREELPGEPGRRRLILDL